MKNDLRRPPPSREKGRGGRSQKSQDLWFQRVLYQKSVKAAFLDEERPGHKTPEMHRTRTCLDRIRFDRIDLFLETSQDRSNLEAFHDGPDDGKSSALASRKRHLSNSEESNVTIDSPAS